MKLVVRPEAEVEANQAAAWYEERQAGLGISFMAELEESFKTIESNAFGQPELEFAEFENAGFRRCTLRRFPYLVLFTIRENEAVVVAIAHTSRKPDYWTDRIS